MKKVSDSVFDLLVFLFRTIFAVVSFVFRTVSALLALIFRAVIKLFTYIFSLVFSRQRKIPRKKGIAKEGRAQAPMQPSMVQSSDDGVVHFVKRSRYVVVENRVYECMGFRGKKERRVAFYDFGELEYWPKKRNDHPDYYFWYLVKIENGVEVCDRGRLRADSIASTQQADDYAKMIREREDSNRAYWAERREKRERDAKRLEELEKVVKDHGWEN